MADLLVPFQFAFGQNAFLIAIMLSVPAAILSCFLVLKGWSLMGDAISHAVLPGVVLSYILGLPLALGAFGAGMTCALATGYLTENSRVKQDTIMGVVFSGMFALGIVMYTKIESDVHLDHILFGNILGVTPADLWLTGCVAVGVTVYMAVKWRDVMIHSFDPVQAKAVGLPVGFLHYMLLIMISLTVVAALKAVGIILAIAMLVAPGAIAFLLTRRMAMMIWVAIAVAVLSSVAGIYASFFIGSAPAPTIVLFMTLIFIAAFVVSVQRTRHASAR